MEITIASSSPSAAPSPEATRNSSEITPTVYIVLAVVVGLVIIVVLLRDRITRFFVRTPQGEIGIDAAAPDAKTPQPPEPPYSVDFSGNKFEGTGGTFRISRDSVRVKDNTVKGERDFLIEEGRPADPEAPADEPKQP
ncbi:MAG: hypothetical protein SFY66_16355 [Oculatellaceae cyanobacterium bins.114]|nr:hypothetical protein [Oculatellaceae cyanobacterium bins.114]